eukprot:SAG31_NODE_42309_length_272_cov_0.601156_1_plen_45_part_10
MRAAMAVGRRSGAVRAGVGSGITYNEDRALRNSHQGPAEVENSGA